MKHNPKRRSLEARALTRLRHKAKPSGKLYKRSRETKAMRAIAAQRVDANFQLDRWDRIEAIDRFVRAFRYIASKGGSWRAADRRTSDLIDRSSST